MKIGKELILGGLLEQSALGGGVGKALVGDALMKRANQGPAQGSYKKGGTVPKTGNYKLHKGETVTPAKKKTETIKLTKTHPHTSITFHPGGLHRSLRVPQSQKIPEKKLEAATHSSSPEVRKQANLAKTMKGWKK